MFSTDPVVYCMGDEYRIFFYTRFPSFAKIRVGGTEFDDCRCGIMRSAKGMRGITVPKSLLDECGEYTVCLDVITARVAYGTKTVKTVEKSYAFRPVKSGAPVRAFMTGDAHGNAQRSVKAAKTFGGFDFLIVNGDMSDKCEKTNSFEVAHNVAAELTRGEIPVVYARGNHENRGAAAELIYDYIPLRNGLTYYTFRLGSIWGLVLDCGEDKGDEHSEYGGSVRFHKFRKEQTAYMRELIDDAQNAFAAPGVEHRVVVSHIPFIRDMNKTFTIENETYAEWAKLMFEIKPDALLSAHMHTYEIMRPGSPHARFPAPCPTVVGTECRDGYLGATGLTFDKKGITVDFVRSDGKTVLSEKI